MCIKLVSIKELHVVVCKSQGVFSLGIRYCVVSIVEGKSNAITGPECSKRLRLPDFKTVGA